MEPRSIRFITDNYALSSSLNKADDSKNQISEKHENVQLVSFIAPQNLLHPLVPQLSVILLSKFPSVNITWKSQAHKRGR